MKRYVTWLVLACLVLGMMPAMSLTAIAEEAPVLSTDKQVYQEGEPIMVTAFGSGKDWCGIYAADQATVGVDSAIRYYYVDRIEGFASGTPVDIRNAFRRDHARPALINIPVGEYKIFLCANDGYEVIAEVSVTVVKRDKEIIPDEVPGNPASAVYESANAGKGRADGTVTISSGSYMPHAFQLWWANADGPIEGYSEMDTVICTGPKTTLNVTPYTLIPQGADRIWVYAANGDKRSETPAVAMLPEGAGDYSLGDVVRELQVLSDVHLTADGNHAYNKNFDTALKEIKKLSPNSVGIFVNGDIVNNGASTEYSQLQKILQKNAEGLPPIHIGIGNHEFFQLSDSDAVQIDRFLKGTGNDSETIYFDVWEGGVHFIFLGSEINGDYAYFSEAQLKWLDELLDRDAETGAPVFLFSHQGIINTVAGTFGYQGWHGIHQGMELSEILKDHPNVILFAGHSHWTLESDGSFKPADDKLPTVLNSAATSYLWDDNANVTQVGVPGSQGYYIYMYDDCIVFRGREFTEGMWVSSAQFILPLAGYGEEGETTEAETTPVTEPTDTGEDGETTPGTEGMTEADTTPVSGTEATTEVGDEKGCASVLVSGVTLGLMTAMAAAFVWQRRK